MHANAEKARIAALADAPRVTGIHDGLIMRGLYGPDGPLTTHDICVSTSSDGSDIFGDLSPTEKLNAHLAVRSLRRWVEVDPAKRFNILQGSRILPLEIGRAHV